MALKGVYMFAALAVCYAAVTQNPTTTTNTTTTPKPTHEPNEAQTLHFVYNGRTHNILLVKVHHGFIDCYVVKLTDDQLAGVHTDASMQQIELGILARLSIAQPVAESSLAHRDANTCHFKGSNKTVNFFTL